MIGPIKRPTIPCASVPPITPTKMTSVGVVRPRPMTSGFKMLSSTPTMPRNSVSRSAMVKSLSVQIQMITGNRTIAAPICTIVRIITAKANRPALGTPASLKPIPASKD